MIIRKFELKDIPEMINIWNEVVEEADAFPQEEGLTMDNAGKFFAEQSFTGVAEEDGEIFGLYILHPNNIGRCGHLSNASYAVKRNSRGKHIGEQLVKHCMEQARKLGYRVLQFNAVVATNFGAMHLYEKLGFTRLGTVPGGYRLKNGEFEDIVLYYIVLSE